MRSGASAAPRVCEYCRHGFAGREIVTAMSIFVASWPLGLAVGLISLPLLATVASWPAAMYAAASTAFACLLIYRDPPNAQSGTNSTFRVAMSGREWLLISLAGLIWSTYNVGYIVLISFLPELFIARRNSLAEAGRIVSLLGWVLIPSVPLSGYVAERLDRPNLLMVAGFCTAALAAAALPFTSAPAAMFALVVIAIGLPAGLIMALPAQSVRPENRSIGIGVYYTFYYAGMALLPALAGLARDLTGSPTATTLYASTMMSLALFGLLGFRTAQRNFDR